MNKFKPGDVVTPKEGTFHFNKYGAFVARVTTIFNDMYNFETIEEGYGVYPIQKLQQDFNTRIDSAENQFEIAAVYYSPLYQALK